MCESFTESYIAQTLGWGFGLTATKLCDTCVSQLSTLFIFSSPESKGHGDLQGWYLSRRLCVCLFTFLEIFFEMLGQSKPNFI